MYLITGASDNHFKSLQNFLTSFFMYKQLDDKIIVYNLDLSEENWGLLQKLFPECIYRVFDYSKYPSYYNINVNAGEYAWKPALIKECLEFITKDSIICWMDSGNIITQNLQSLESLINKCSIYSPISISGYIKSWTHKGTLEYMKPPKEFLEYRNRNGACIAFDTSKEWIKEFINEWAHLASIKECIAPEGSSRENHRQDQTVLSIMYYFYHQKHRFHIYDDFLGYTIHNDSDEPESVNLAIVCLENHLLDVDKILSVLEICKTKRYDLYYYNLMLNNKIYTNHFSVFLDSILKEYKQVVLLTNKTSLSRQIQPIKFFKNSDSYGGDLEKVIPWSASSILSVLCSNNQANAINTLGYVKNMINPVQENSYLQNGGIFTKTNETSKLYITLDIVQWISNYIHFNIILPSDK